ncbi:MAG: hypothetical protein H7263_01860 [Candidatus Sericytochromatia bacterium]|nr:hypothetical protein [Candidatus Sericytochromatia bacterium]
MENKLVFSGEGKLSHKNFGLDHDVSWNIDFDLKEINRGNIINLNVKMPGIAITNPYDLPYENYILDGQIDSLGLSINSEKMLLKEWKEVFLYSYGMKFVSDSLQIGNFEKIDRLDFFIPNFLIGYDEMSFGEEIINYTDIKLNIDNQNFLFKLVGNSKFNNKDNFNNLDAQTDFTTTLIVTSEDGQLNYHDTLKIVDNFFDLLGLAYGTKRPWLMVKGYFKNELIGQYIRDVIYHDTSNIFSSIPITFSGELSNFIKDIFPKYYILDKNIKYEFTKLFNQLSGINAKVNLSEAFKNLEQTLKYCSLDHISFKENDNNVNEINFKNLFKDIDYSEFRLNSFLKRSKDIYRSDYKEGDYKIFLQTLSLLYKFIFRYFDYQGKYWDWSNISPVIKENEF